MNLKYQKLKKYNNLNKIIKKYFFKAKLLMIITKHNNLNKINSKVKINFKNYKQKINILKNNISKINL